MLTTVSGYSKVPPHYLKINYSSTPTSNHTHKEQSREELSVHLLVQICRHKLLLLLHYKLTDSRSKLLNLVTVLVQFWFPQKGRFHKWYDWICAVGIDKRSSRDIVHTWRFITASVKMCSRSLLQIPSAGRKLNHQFIKSGITEPINWQKKKALQMFKSNLKAPSVSSLQFSKEWDFWWSRHWSGEEFKICFL